MSDLHIPSEPLRVKTVSPLQRYQIQLCERGTDTISTCPESLRDTAMAVSQIPEHMIMSVIS